MATTNAYKVTAHLEGRWWVFEIPELGTGGKARTLKDVNQEAQCVAAMWLNVAAETVAVAVHVVCEGAAVTERAFVNAHNGHQATARATRHPCGPNGYSATIYNYSYGKGIIVK